MPTILYEDEALLAVAKPAGMVTHPAYRHLDGTLTDAIFARQAARGEELPWLLHRLDRETSGVVLFAKTEVARRALVRQFERHTIRKQYLALIEGALTPALGEIEEPLLRDPSDRRRVIVSPDGQSALTRYRTLGTVAADRSAAADTTVAVDVSVAASLAAPSAATLEPTVYSLVLAEPVTGRTHQIRAHLAARGAVILGDAQYLALAAECAAASAGDTLATLAPAPAGAPRAVILPMPISAPRVMLHAWRLTCRYPTSPGAPFVVTAPPPADLLALIRRLGLADALESLAPVDMD